MGLKRHLVSKRDSEFHRTELTANVRIWEKRMSNVSIIATSATDMLNALNDVSGMTIQHISLILDTSESRQLTSIRTEQRKDGDEPRRIFSSKCAVISESTCISLCSASESEVESSEIGGAREEEKSRHCSNVICTNVWEESSGCSVSDNGLKRLLTGGHQYCSCETHNYTKTTSGTAPSPSELKGQVVSFKQNASALCSSLLESLT